MVMKLSNRAGETLYVDTSRVILAEEHTKGWFVTIEALELAPLGGPGSNVRHAQVAVSRVLDLDPVGAGLLIKHLDGRSQAHMGP